MHVTDQNLALVYKGFKALYTTAYLEAPAHHEQVAMTVPSSASTETYGWLGSFPGMREWLGERIVNTLSTHSFTIPNRKFEATVEVDRDDIADDRIGVHKPFFAEMGRNARQHPSRLCFDLLKRGFELPCYDGQAFFDPEHPVGTGAGSPELVPNMQAGTGTPWFLLDTSRAIKPLIWQERENYEFQTVNNHSDRGVFLTDKYLYGIRARVNAGLGLWQLAYGSKAELTVANYAAARAAMGELRGDRGEVLGIMPTLMVVPPSLEAEARAVLKAAQVDGTTNVWADSAELLVTPYVA